MPAASAKRFKPSKYVPVSAAAIFLVGATTLFFAFTCPWLSLYVSPVIPVYNAVVFLFVLANFSMATFMDPGIFPRAEEDEDKEDDFRAPLYKTVEIKGIQVRMKWCATCRFYRPPRCSHCSVCDNCVEEFDHHCPWVNNCIGRRNYRYFFLFLLSLTTHIMGVFGFGLLYVLYQVELSGVRMAITMAVMCVASLFFIPVAGLTGFHVVLVARGRTTNEQVTGKFRGGVNPFTNGCCKNVSRVLCSSPAPRYLGRPRAEQTVLVRPPFLRPDVSDGQITVKIMDNGIQTELKRTKSKGSLEVTESQSADAEPPPPPKPDLSRYTGLRTHLTLATTEDSGLLGKDSPPTPTMYKYRPGYSSSSSSAALPHSTSAKLSRVNSLKEPNSICDGGRKPSYRSEPSLEPESFRSPTFGKSFPFDPLSSGSRSSSLKSAQGTGFELGHLQSIRSEGTTSTSYKSLANQTRNGSLSYDSLLTPSDSPDFESVQAGPEPEAPVGYTSPFLSARIAQQRESDLHGRFATAASPKHAAPREPSPVRYDNLSRHIVASIQEREKLLQQPAAAAPGREDDAGLVDSGGAAPRGGSSSSSDDCKRSPLGKNPLTRPAPPRFGKPEPPHALRARSLGSPEQPAAPHLGKSVSYSSQKAASQPEAEEVALQPLLAPKDEVQLRPSYSKSNGQPKSLGPAAPGAGPVPLSSPTRGGVKKVSGVGGTTYEISTSGPANRGEAGGEGGGGGGRQDGGGGAAAGAAVLGAGAVPLAGAALLPAVRAARHRLPHRPQAAAALPRAALAAGGRQPLRLRLAGGGDPHVPQRHRHDEEPTLHHGGAAHREHLHVQQSGQRHPLLPSGHPHGAALPHTLHSLPDDLQAAALHGPRVHQVLQRQDHRRGAGAGQAGDLDRRVLRQLVQRVPVLRPHLRRPLSQVQLLRAALREGRRGPLHGRQHQVQGEHLAPHQAAAHPHPVPGRHRGHAAPADRQEGPGRVLDLLGGERDPRVQPERAVPEGQEAGQAARRGQRGGCRGNGGRGAAQRGEQEGQIAAPRPRHPPCHPLSPPPPCPLARGPPA